MPMAIMATATIATLVAVLRLAFGYGRLTKPVETIETDRKETKADGKQLLIGQAVIMGWLDIVPPPTVVESMTRSTATEISPNR